MMHSASLSTYYAPAQRSSAETIARQSDLFCSDHFFAKMVDAIPSMIMVLNQDRQIVFTNRRLVETLSIVNEDLVLGLRPGELLHCKRSAENEGGCGTSAACRYCGSVNAILKSQRGENGVEECRMAVQKDGFEESLDLRVWTMPLEVSGTRYTVFSIENIADEKKKFFLERIFLHDILNTANALRGFSELIRMDALDQAARDEFMARIHHLSNRIIEEINAHRQLIAAENNELEINPTAIDSLGLLQTVFTTFNTPEMLNGRFLHLDEESQAVTLISDESLLIRVIGNMIKNALEASVPGETVSVGCYGERDHVHFRVRNPAYMPENIRLQVFNRSFSTKGIGRGLGTYSMKYLTEKYLMGKISFESLEGKGTTFTASYPLQIV